MVQVRTSKAGFGLTPEFKNWLDEVTNNDGNKRTAYYSTKRFLFKNSKELE